MPVVSDSASTVSMERAFAATRGPLNDLQVNVAQTGAPCLRDAETHPVGELEPALHQCRLRVGEVQAGSLELARCDHRIGAVRNGESDR